MTTALDVELARLIAELHGKPPVNNVSDAEILREIERHRQSLARRIELAETIREARREFLAGQAQIANVDEIVDELKTQD